MYTWRARGARISDTCILVSLVHIHISDTCIPGGPEVHAILTLLPYLHRFTCLGNKQTWRASRRCTRLSLSAARAAKTAADSTCSQGTRPSICSLKISSRCAFRTVAAFSASMRATFSRQRRTLARFFSLSCCHCTCVLILTLTDSYMRTQTHTHTHTHICTAPVPRADAAVVRPSVGPDVLRGAPARDLAR